MLLNIDPVDAALLSEAYDLAQFDDRNLMALPGTVRHAIRRVLDTIQAVQKTPVLPTINAQFECVDGELTGHTNVPIKRIEQQDDGSFTVVIDHWPAKVTKLTSSTEDLVVWPDGSMCLRSELSQYEWKGDDYEFIYYGSGAWQALSNI